MGAIDTGKNITQDPATRKKKRARVRKPKTTVTVTRPDAGDSSRTTPARTQKKTVRVRVTRPDANEATRTESIKDSRAKNIPAASDSPRTRAADTKRAEDYVRSQYKGHESQYVQGTTVQPRTRIKAQLKAGYKNPASGQRTAAVQAPVLKVLQQTTRPLHAVANVADTMINKPALPGSTTHAALRGFENKDKTTFSDVLKHAGVKNKAVAGAAGFVLDVGLDPTTYVTGGAGSIAEREALKAAAGAEKKALRAGLSKEQAARFGERAHAQALKKSDHTTGVTVKVAGHELPGVRKATAKASKPARAVSRKVVPQRVRSAARAVGADLNPDVAPAGVGKETSRQAVQATRTARSKASRGSHEAVQQAVGIRERVGEANYSRIIDAIENGTISQLPADLREAAVLVRSRFRYSNRLRKQAGIRGGEIKRRGQVTVPAVTADPAVTARTVSAARRAEASAQRAVETATQAHDIHQGRAEVMSRNVSGSSAEKAAERGRRKRRVRIAPRYAGGGKGVQDTAAALRSAEQHLTQATTARKTAEATHEAEKAAAAAQRAARNQALETNARRAAAPVEYIPHNLTDQAREAEAKAASGGVGRKVIRPSSSRHRSDNRPLSEIRKTEPDRFSEDLPALYATHHADASTAVARAELNRRVADLGRDVKKGQPIVLRDGESVYHIVGSDIRKVDDKEAAQVAQSGGTKGRYVVLHDDIVKRATEGVQPHTSEGVVKLLDKTQGGFKRLALATPGFHTRNAVGDTQNAYLGQAGYRLPGNMVRAGRVLKAEGHRDRALKTLKPAPARAGTISTPRYGEVTYEQAAEQLAKHGAMRSGYTARELPELSKGRLQARMPAGFRRALLNREDLPRVTTALEALRNGATWEQAAQRVADYHFDYAHLTSFERNVARRGAPFYTFTARNIPRQFKSLATHPGKFANYQKLIEEASKATGMDEESQKYRTQTARLKAAGVKLPKGWQSLLSQWEQRNAGIPVNWRGHKFTMSFGLPLASGLNEVPGAASKGQLDEYFQTAMSLVTPIIKDPVEYFDNYSFFFRNQIESDTSPLVSAPSYVAALPKSVRDDLGVVRGMDKRTGRQIWRWPGKVDYIVKTVPGMPQYAQQLATEGTNRRGKGTGGKALQALTGLRAEPFDPDKTITDLAYQRVREIQKRQAALRQSTNPANGFPISAANPTREYVKLAQQLKIAQAVAYQGQAAQGYKVLPKQGGPSKARLGGSGGRVKLGGGSGTKVRLGGSSGTRVRLGG